VASTSPPLAPSPPTDQPPPDQATSATAGSLNDTSSSDLLSADGGGTTASDDSGGGAAGVIGAAIGVALLLAVLLLIVAVRRRKQKGSQQPGSKPRASRRHVQIDVSTTHASVTPDGIELKNEGNGTGTAEMAITATSKHSDSSGAGILPDVSPSKTSVRKKRAIEAMQEWKWRADAIVWEDQVGAGSFGSVFKVRYGDELLAAKRMDVHRSAAYGARMDVENALAREFKALFKVDHANIVQLMGVVLDHDEWVCLLMELADKGSLRQLLDASPEMIIGNQSVQLSIALDIASGLAHCHEFKPPLLHHDIKSANVLIFDAAGSAGGGLVAKLSDFGLAGGLSGTSTAAATTRTKTHAAGGTLAYRAPETFVGRYTTASEVYSYAIVLWELLTGRKPWHRDENGNPYMEGNVMNLVCRKKRPEMPSPISRSMSSPRRAGALEALMRRCWSHDPKKRPSFAAIVEHLKPMRPATDADTTHQAMASSLTATLESMQQEMQELRAVSSPLTPSSSSMTSSVFAQHMPSEAFDDVFISFRFGEAHTEALALKAALEARQYKVFLANVSPGANLQQVIASALLRCRLAVILATRTYGRQTNGLFCTSAEMNFIVSQHKPYYLVRMLPFDENWTEPATTMAFPPSIMQKVWLPNEPIPADLVDEVCDKLAAQQSSAQQTTP